MTFKANWEKAHTRITLSKNTLLKMLGTYYNIKKDVKTISIIAGGCSNINALVHLNNLNNPVILRVYLQDKNSAYKEQKIASLLQGKLAVPRFHHVAEGFGYAFAIIEWLPGQTLRDLLLSNEKININNIMFKVGEVLGAISGIKFSSSGFFNENFAIAGPLSSESFTRFCFDCLEDEKVKKTIAKEQIKQIIKMFIAYENLLPDETEKNLVHADFDPANILVTKVNGQIEVTGILDWEFAFSSSTLCDVATMLRYAHHMPVDYQGFFLKGLLSTGYKLPKNWQTTIKLLNIISLLDCLKRSDFENRPNQITDIKNLLNYILKPQFEPK